MNPAAATESIVQEVEIKASAERVFEALVNPDQLMAWWGAKGQYEITQVESDPRSGGKRIVRGNGMGGRTFSIIGEYREVERPRLLVFTWLPDWQPDATESVVRFDLEEMAGVTKVKVTHSGLTAQGRESHRGWPQVLGWLKAYTER